MTARQIGNTSPGSGSGNTPPVEGKVVTGITNTTGYTIPLTSAHGYFHVNASAKVKAVIYEDSLGVPGSLRATSNEKIGLTEGLNDFTFSSPWSIGPGIIAWIGIIADRACYSGSMYAADGVNFVRYNADTYSDGPISIFGAHSAVGGQMTFYVQGDDGVVVDVSGTVHFTETNDLFSIVGNSGTSGSTGTPPPSGPAGFGGVPINDRDVLLQATHPRYSVPTDRALVLSASATVFQPISITEASPATINFVATLLNMSGVVTFSATGGSTIFIDGNTATLNYANMIGASTIVMATITVDGVIYESSVTITRVVDNTLTNSQRHCYSKTSLTSLAASPVSLSTAGDTSFPPDDSWGIGTHWVNSPPIVGAGENIYISDGVFSPLASSTIWSAPYLASLKVGELSALSASLGTVEIKAGGYLRTEGVTSYAVGNGIWMGDAGSSVYKFRIGNPNGNRLTWDGTNLNIVGGGVFSGALQAASGTFAGALQAATGTFSGTLSANALNVVDTLNIAGNAVTVPASVSGYGGAGPFGSNSGMWQVSAATVNVSYNVNAPINILVTWMAGNVGTTGGNTTVEVHINGAVVLASSETAGNDTNSHVASAVATIGAGSHQITLWFGNDWWDSNDAWALGQWSLTVLGVKR